MRELDKAFSLLKKDINKNISFINFFNQNKIIFIKVLNQSVIGKGTSDNDWVYISCSNPDELQALLSYVKEDLYFAVLEDWMLPIITENKEVEWKLSTRRYILPEQIIMDDPSQRFSSLKLQDAEYIYNNSKYKDYLSVEYIKERISKGIHCGTKENDKLIAWCISQDDGALGFLTVLPEYRGKGYGMEVLTEAVRKVRENDAVPFAYIEDSNQRATSLCLKLGFEPDRLIHWIKLKK